MSPSLGSLETFFVCLIMWALGVIQGFFVGRAGKKETKLSKMQRIIEHEKEIERLRKEIEG